MHLKVDLGLAGKDGQHAVTDESLYTVTGYALGTDVCHWTFKTKVNMVQGQEDGPLIPACYALFFWFCIKRSPKDQSCMLLYDSQATNISLMAALALSTWISDAEDGMQGLP